MYSKPRRAFDRLFLPKDMKEGLWTDIKKFVDSKEWYELSEVPHRRGKNFSEAKFNQPADNLPRISLAWTSRHRKGKNLLCLGPTELSVTRLQRYMPWSV